MATVNFFSLLDTEEDPEAVVSRAAAEKEQQAKKTTGNMR